MLDNRAAAKVKGRPLNTLGKARKAVDTAMVVTLMLLLLAGLLVLFSATYYTAQDHGDALGEVKEQLIGIGLGFVALLVTSRMPFSFWRKLWVVLTGLGASAVLLVLVLIAFVVVVLGGLGSIAGALIGGLAIGLIETLSGFFIGSEMRQMAYFLVFLAVLLFRPAGLFGQRGSEKLGA